MKHRHLSGIEKTVRDEQIFRLWLEQHTIRLIDLAARFNLCTASISVIIKHQRHLENIRSKNYHEWEINKEAPLPSKPMVSSPGLRLDTTFSPKHYLATASLKKDKHDS